MYKILKNLNDKQKKIVNLFNKNILVLAGAGSGKTRIIVYKIIWAIIKKNINPNSILVVTFTNKAANEIKNRVNNILNNNFKMDWIGTFHGLSYQILKFNYKESNLNSNFQIIDSSDQIKIIKNIIKNNRKLSLIKNISINQILKYINFNKENGIRENKINESDYNSNYLIIYKKYQEICKNSNFIDFSELLIRSYELLINKKSILDKYRNKFNIILIDEFQDTNKIQYEWIKLINHSNNFITAVGDDDQAIYGWRGANINNIRNFLINFKNSKIIYLEQNYRSTKNIIQASNYLISNNKNRSNKKIWTIKDFGPLIDVYEAKDEIEEASFIIRNIINEKNKLYKFAILYRKNSQSRIIEEYLLLNKLKYKIYGGLRFLDRKEIKDSISYLRVIINRNDNFALERIINFPSRKIGDKTIKFIKNISFEKNISYWDSILYIIKNSFKKYEKNLKKFVLLINYIDNKIKNYPLPIQISKVIKYSGLWEFYENEDKNNRYLFSKIDNLIELINSSQKYCDINNLNGKKDLEEFISYILIQSNISLESNINSNIYLMTIHASKGLEFDKVFIIGMEEGIFPLQDSILNINLLEEERRLAYVAFTRTIKKLTLIYSKRRLYRGKYIFNKKSRFINEIPNRYLYKF